MSSSHWISLLAWTIEVSKLSVRSFYARTFIIPSVTSDTNTRSLSLCRDPGSPNLGTISFINVLTTSAAVSVLCPQTTKDNLKFPGTLDMTVKLICQSSPGYIHLVWLGLIWGPLGWYSFGVVYCADGTCLTIWLILLFMPGITISSADHLHRASLLCSWMSLSDGLISCSLRKELLPMFIN